MSDKIEGMSVTENVNGCTNPSIEYEELPTVSPQVQQTF